MGGCPHTDVDPNELTLSGCKSHMFSPGFNSKGRFCLISGPWAFSVRGML